MWRILTHEDKKLCCLSCIELSLRSLQPCKLPHILHFHILDLVDLHPRLDLIQQPLCFFFFLLDSPLLLLFLGNLQIELLQINREAAMEPFETLRVPLALKIAATLSADLHHPSIHPSIRPSSNTDKGGIKGAH